jgi:hypothetical protein
MNGLVVRIADAMLSRVLINTTTLTQNFKVQKLQLSI